MRRVVRGLLSCVAIAASSAGCNSDNNPNPGGGGALVASVALSVTPNPIATIQTSAIGPTFGVRYKVTIRESAGLGGKIELLTASLFDDANGALLSRNQLDDRDLIVFVGANRVEARGSLEIQQDLSYQAAQKKPTSVVIGARFRDDRGNLLEPSFLVKAN